MVAFLAGFPDDTRSFDAVAPAFEGTHAVLKLALPGYEGPPITERWGLPFKVLIEKMHDAVEAQPHGDGRLSSVRQSHPKARRPGRASWGPGAGHSRWM